ncbi:complement C1q tumor necrosis factor-related protein 3-like [Sardina pilchardus]|uniref:complement C1q tumor necrosis factor-related protein 3-like n=1 Tax=Sardina pilchardus TaxID=27697 RepID=UPI002E11EB26
MVYNLGTTVVELRTTLSFTQNELQNTNFLLYTMETENDALHTEMAVLKSSLAASETEVELTAVKTRLAATETDVVNLEEEITEQPKVAFSAALTDSGYIQSGNTDLNLVFTKIITNVGQAYSSTTGFFTAPVRGVYYFRFTVMDILSSRSMGITMNKNGEQIMYLWEYDTDATDTYLSSGASLQLEEGDVVNMRLPAGMWLYDDPSNRNTFSGFLLFPLRMEHSPDTNCLIDIAQDCNSRQPKLRIKAASNLRVTL